MRPFPVSSRVSGRGLFAAATVLAAFTFTLGTPAPLAAQATKKKNEAQVINGKLTAIEKKGKVTEWKVEVEGGDPIEITFTAKIPQLEITGKADSGFLQPETVISAVANRQGNDLTFKDYTVHLGATPQLRMVRDQNSPVESYEICAVILAADGDNLRLNTGRGVFNAKLAQGAEASIESTDPTMVPEGNPVSIEGVTRSGKFLPSKVKVSLDKVVSGEEYFASQSAPKSKTASKSKEKDTSRTTKSKTTKTKDEPATVTGGGLEASDPFGLKKKPSAKSEEKKREEKK